MKKRKKEKKKIISKGSSWVLCLLVFIVIDFFAVFLFFVYRYMQTYDESVSSYMYKNEINNEDNLELIGDTISENDKKNISKLNGVELEEGIDNDLRPYAVMVENSSDARPLSGINEASIVYEALAEAKITRFLFIFDGSTNVPKIGPIRSARPYFVKIAEEYSPLYVHFGGSNQALYEISNNYYDIISLNGMVYENDYFWRNIYQIAPHNAYSSTDLIKDYISDFNIENENNIESYKFNNNKNYLSKFKNNSVAESVFIKYGTPNYNVLWKYNEKTNNYERFYSKNNPYYDLDSKDNIIETKNIVIQFVETSVIDSVGRKKMVLESNLGGDVILIRDGKYIEGKWFREDKKTKFFVEDSEYKFTNGKIWVNIVPINTNIEIK
ncbi:DUF3048 domain-containing protein [Patescibacteria group bacterium]|nr:DUF3048 domain-containing protein [Patescibacteria group bacterium]